MEEREKEPNKQVYIGHLPYDVEKSDLEDLFGKFGHIDECSVKRRFAFMVRNLKFHLIYTFLDF